MNLVRAFLTADKLYIGEFRVELFGKGSYNDILGLKMSRVHDRYAELIRFKDFVVLDFARKKYVGVVLESERSQVAAASRAYSDFFYALFGHSKPQSLAVERFFDIFRESSVACFAFKLAYEQTFTFDKRAVFNADSFRKAGVNAELRA